MEGMMMTSKTYKVANNITIRNNVFKNCTSWGICASAIKNVKVYNNTFDMTGGIHGAGCAAESSCEFKNNIFYNGRSVYWFDKAATIIDGTDAAPGKNNVLYRTGITIRGYANDVINKDPLFIDRDNNNYKLQSASPALKSGTRITEWSPATDKDGNFRSQTSTWSCGAYEAFQSGGTPASSSRRPR
jgi:parallel beta-helix repeat protein